MLKNMFQTEKEKKEREKVMLWLAQSIVKYKPAKQLLTSLLNIALFAQAFIEGCNSLD